MAKPEQRAALKATAAVKNILFRLQKKPYLRLVCDRSHMMKS